MPAVDETCACMLDAILQSFLVLPWRRVCFVDKSLKPKRQNHRTRHRMANQFSMGGLVARLVPPGRALDEPPEGSAAKRGQAVRVSRHRHRDLASVRSASSTA